MIHRHIEECGQVLICAYHTSHSATKVRDFGRRKWLLKILLATNKSVIISLWRDIGVATRLFVVT